VVRAAVDFFLAMSNARPFVRRLARTERTGLTQRRIVQANGVDLCTQTFGDPADAAILLVHGATASMSAWDDGFCERLAAGGRFVIRYDHRDTGQSVSYPPGAPGYTLHDLVADAVALLDVFGVRRAHLVGRSMGGGIVMQAALDHPERVASLTLIGTSPGGCGLPAMSQEFLAFVSGPGPDWSQRDAVVDHILGMLRIFSAGSGHLDESTLRGQLAAELDRTANVASSQINHFVMDVGRSPRDRLAEIDAPTLVIHGANDPVFPLGHALALQQEIRGARLLVLERTGHEVPRATWELVVPSILNHTSLDH
jgi:pimeloyl-ACP methyl ester carboxylesterase